MMYRFLPICVVLLARYSVAQAPDRVIRFEVASVRSANPGSGPMRVVMYGGPGSSDPERFTALNATLLMLITNAYDVPSNQLDGPSWLRTERFDISAKVPPGTTKSQFSSMLKNLLAERFKLAAHEEERQATVFALVVDKKGLKIEQSVITPLA